MPSIHDIDVLARTLWAEARGEGVRGMEAIASVIMNRKNDPRWPNTIAGVCQQPGQFSCHDPDNPNYSIIYQIDTNDQSFAQAYAVATMAVAGMFPDRTKGANHYLTMRLFGGPNRPSWADWKAVTCTIGNHVFLRLLRES